MATLSDAVAAVRKLLLSTISDHGASVEIHADVGTEGYTQDGVWLLQRPNGTMTIKIEVNGGAKRTGLAPIAPIAPVTINAVDAASFRQVCDRSPESILSSGRRA